MNDHIFDGRVWHVWGMVAPKDTATKAQRRANKRNARNRAALPLLAWSNQIESVAPTVTGRDMLEREAARRADFLSRMKRSQRDMFAQADAHIARLIEAIGLEEVQRLAAALCASMRPKTSCYIADYWHSQCRQRGLPCED